MAVGAYNNGPLTSNAERSREEVSFQRAFDSTSAKKVSKLPFFSEIICNSDLRRDGVRSIAPGEWQQLKQFAVLNLDTGLDTRNRIE